MVNIYAFVISFILQYAQTVLQKMYLFWSYLFIHILNIPKHAVKKRHTNQFIISSWLNLVNSFAIKTQQRHAYPSLSLFFVFLFGTKTISFFLIQFYDSP